MARKKRKSPTWAHPAMYAGLRAATVVPLVAGVRPSLEAARVAGRAFGNAPFNRKRLRRASETLSVAMPDLDEPARVELALNGYEHLAMLAAEICHLPRALNDDGWIQHVELAQLDGAVSMLMRDRPCISLTGHCGNWEVLGYTLAVLGFPMHILYRPLDMKPLDDWVRRTRARRGLMLIDKFGAAAKLPALLEQNATLGFAADQNAGDRGLFVPFFGRLASTYKTIGLLAIQSEVPVVCGMARRLGWDHHANENTNLRAGNMLQHTVGMDGLRFRIEIHDVIEPSDWKDQPDPLFYVTARYRRAIENMVRSAPEQYLWMHRMWKSRPRHERLNKPFPPQLREKLMQLPWLDEAEVDRLMDRSDQDRAFLTERGIDRLP